ncbi:histone-lysine N-methyltransferase 2D-like [Penaeus indicus]|uniref:histone-lysine N-methyltransferase 2D-like n=1 Tax=Penaeus indicus TaxID=29960 RepID=UPI00300C5324
MKKKLFPAIQKLSKARNPRSAAATMSSILSQTASKHNLDGALTCSVCFESYGEGERKPLMLPSCGHTFCKQCVHGIIASENKGQFQCPTCRRSQPVLSLDDLPVNYSLLEVASLSPTTPPEEGFKEKTLKEEERCPDHGSRLAFWCSSCESATCGECLFESHPRPDHDVLKLEDHFKKLWEEAQQRSNRLVRQMSHVSTENVSMLKGALVEFAELLRQRREIDSIQGEARAVRDAAKGVGGLLDLSAVSRAILSLQEKFERAGIETPTRVNVTGARTSSSGTPKGEGATPVSETPARTWVETTGTPVEETPSTPARETYTTPEEITASTPVDETYATPTEEITTATPAYESSPEDTPDTPVNETHSAPMEEQPSTPTVTTPVPPAVETLTPPTRNNTTPTSPPAKPTKPPLSRKPALPFRPPALTPRPTSLYGLEIALPGSSPTPICASPLTSKTTLTTPTISTTPTVDASTQTPPEDTCVKTRDSPPASGSLLKPPRALSSLPPWSSLLCGIYNSNWTSGKIAMEPKGLHVYSLHPMKEKCDLFLHLSVIEALAPLESPLVFMDLRDGTSPLGRLYITLQIHLRRAQQFFSLCLGDRGPSYKGSFFHSVMRRGGAGEGLAGGDYEQKAGKGGAAIMRGLEERETATQTGTQAGTQAAREAWVPEVAKRCERGMIIRASTRPETAAQFLISVKDGPRFKTVFPFGRVSHGIEVVEEACRRPAHSVCVADCGWVLPL